MEYSTITVKKALMVSSIIFFISLISLPQDDSKPNLVLVILLNSFFWASLVCSVILLYRLITMKSRQNESDNTGLVNDWDFSVSNLQLIEKTKKILKFSVIIYLADFCFFPSDSEPSPIILRIAVASMLIIIGGSLYLFYLLIVRERRQNMSNNHEFGEDRIYCASQPQSTYTTINLLKVSLITFGVYLVIYHDDNSLLSFIMLRVGAISLLVFFGCCAILLCQLIIRKYSHFLYKNIHNTKQGSDRAYFTTNPQPMETTLYTSLDNVEQNNDLDQQQDFSCVGSRLTTIWTDDISHVISFDYPNSSGYDVAREIILTAIEINEKNEVHFVGFCFDHNDHQIFIANRISGNIKYAGQQYRISKFLTEELGLDLEYVMGLVF